MALNYLDPADPVRLRSEHEKSVEPWLAAAPSARPLAARDAGERLRIGLASHDFRQHPVAFFLEGMLRELDRTRYELFFYSDVRKEDSVTARLRAWGDAWRDIQRLDNDAFAAIIAADQIHLMIDLAGHTNGNRLAAFARRLAPVQATYLGYGATTGLTTIDHLLADDVIAPLDEGEAHYTEQVVRLGPILASYSPPTSDVPLAASAPMATKGHVTFGSFAQLRKISPSSVRLWISALEAVAGSRLLVMSKGLASPAARARFLAPFVAAGIDAARFDLRGAGSLEEYLNAHNEVDLILDTTPWSGHTTTLHGLWMGVPTLCLRGSSQTGRFGEMVLRAAAMEEFVVADPAEFGERAVALLAGRLAASADRTALRQALLGSPLCDHRTMARRFERACDAMWETRGATQ
jgi:protein O-GlcNAc transferase